MPVTDVDRAVAAALVSVPGVRAVSLGGSRAVGLDDRGSDTDLYAWYRGALADPRVRKRALGDLAADLVSYDIFGPEDHWHTDGRLVEVVYLDLDVIESLARDAATDGLGGEVCATAFLHTAYAGVPIDDPFGDLERLRAELATFPEATRRRQFAELPLMADEFASQLAKAQSREDWPMVVRRRAGLVDVVVSLVFALNRRYHPGEKRLLVHVDACPVRPVDLVGRLEAACLTDPDDASLAPQLLALVAETAALYD